MINYLRKQLRNLIINFNLSKKYIEINAAANLFYLYSNPFINIKKFVSF